MEVEKVIKVMVLGLQESQNGMCIDLVSRAGIQV